ncbi:hypothetical protein [Chitinilyticum aquatile]|uniref:hypothetical protein n=1 Tax=Chitinilyticum aquatile TaxID=362520 RepID=UPI00040A958A|nr:hypothetical protein [Chitinilyticum aquatile]
MAEQEDASGLPHDDELSRLYSQLDSVRPTVQTDRIILAAARKTIAADHGGTLARLKEIALWLLAPRHITAIASLAVISFLGLMVIQRPLPQPEAIDEQSQPATRTETEAAGTDSQQPASTFDKQAAQPSDQEQAQPRSSTIRNPIADRKKENTEPAQARPSALAPAPQEAIRPIAPPPAEDRGISINGSAEMDLTVTAGRGEAKTMAAPSAPTAPDPAESILQDITKALELGERDTAYRLYLKLKQQHPDFKIPPALEAEFAGHGQQQSGK